MLKLRKAKLHPARKQKGVATGIQESQGLGREGRVPIAPYLPMGTPSVSHPKSSPDTSTISAILAWHLGRGVRDPETQGRFSEATDGMRRFPWERPPSSRGTPHCTCVGIASRSCAERSPPYIKPSSQLRAFAHPVPTSSLLLTVILLKSSASPPSSHSRHLQPTSHIVQVPPECQASCLC